MSKKEAESEDLFFILAYEPQPEGGHFQLVDPNTGFDLLKAPSGRVMLINRQTREWSYWTNA
jgi:hypothetical protein